MPTIAIKIMRVSNVIIYSHNYFHATHIEIQLRMLFMNNLRRKLNQIIISIPVLGAPLFSKAQSSLQSATKRLATPQDGEGPFYPKQWDGELDNDLLNFNGKQYANGTPMTLTGKAYSTDGNTLKGATVEIWQCDEIGEYRHPKSGGEAPAQRGFQGYARVQSSIDGSFTFRTLKPVPYNGRPAHVHFRVIAAGYRDLTTQMYFQGENQEGNLLLKIYGFFGGFARERDRLTASLETVRTNDRNEFVATFDLTLERNT
jgi:protocatechuate 3,4-dioxygenase, beta subunit